MVNRILDDEFDHLEENHKLQLSIGPKPQTCTSPTVMFRRVKDVIMYSCLAILLTRFRELELSLQINQL